MKTITKIQHKNTVYLCYIWQSVYEISEISELNKLGVHGNEYPHNKAYGVFQNFNFFISANNECISLNLLQHTYDQTSPPSPSLSLPNTHVPICRAVKAAFSEHRNFTTKWL